MRLALGVAGIVNVLADPPEDLHLESGFHFLVAEASHVPLMQNSYNL